MSEEASKNRTIVTTAVTTAGIVAALTMSIIAIAQTSSRTPSEPASAPARQTAQVATKPQPQNASIVIQHVLRGCHSMVVNGKMPMSPNATLHLTPGSTLNVTDNDVMPHKLVQLAGPSATLSGAAMSHMGAQSTVTFPKAGTYTLTTKAGEDYMKGVKTIGEDNTLKIRVQVAA